MTSVFKYDLKLGTTVIKMPEGARVLTTQIQYDKICIWALVEPDNEMVERRFITIGTGHHIEDGQMNYIGTVQMMDGNLVWHIFEDMR